MPPKTSSSSYDPNAVDDDDDPAALIEEAPKALRHILEEELRKLSLEECIDRLLQIATDAKQTEPTLTIRRRTVIRQRSVGEEIVFVAVLEGNDSGVQPTVHEAVVCLGANLTGKLEKQAEGLRDALAKVNSRIARVRGTR